MEAGAGGIRKKEGMCVGLPRKEERMKRYVLEEVEKAGALHSDGTQRYLIPGTNGKNEYLRLEPKNIHEGEQALLEAVLKELRGCLSYGTPKGGPYTTTPRLYVPYPQCDRLERAEVGVNIVEQRLIFTPPEPEPDKESLDYLLTHRPSGVCQEAADWLEKVLEAKDDPKS